MADQYGSRNSNHPEDPYDRVQHKEPASKRPDAGCPIAPEEDKMHDGCSGYQGRSYQGKYP